MLLPKEKEAVEALCRWTIPYLRINIKDCAKLNIIKFITASSAQLTKIEYLFMKFLFVKTNYVNAKNLVLNFYVVFVGKNGKNIICNLLLKMKELD